MADLDVNSGNGAVEKDLKASGDMSQQPDDGFTEKQRNKLKDLAERVGLTFDDVLRRKLSQKALKKMVTAAKYKNMISAKRKEEKMKRKIHRKQMRENGIKPPKLKKKSHVLMKDSENKMIVVIDCSFDHLMNQKESRKLRKQLHRCYSINRNSGSPLQLYFTSLKGELKEGLNQQNPGHENWDVNMTDKHFTEIFDDHKNNGKIVYLSCDSPHVVPDTNVLKAEAGSKVYVVGGLVDHNVHKGLTHGMAADAKLDHARLPIDDYIKMSSSRVLTVNQGEFDSDGVTR